VVAPEQPPESSQVPVVVRVEPVHISVAHTTPVLPLKRAHAPVPSQTPVVPHVSAVWVGQRSPGSVPGSAGRQVPSVPGFTQVKQAAPQASLQHTPSTHWPEPHSDGEVQFSPICFDGLSTPPVSIGTPISPGASWPASTLTLSPPPPQAAAVSTTAARSTRAAEWRKPTTKATAIRKPFARGQ
jgi:hypothetical protein